MTEKGKAYQLELKFANQNSAFKVLKEQIEIINVINDLPETEIEQLEAERDHLDQLKDEFTDAHRDYDDLLESELEREVSYRWFDTRDREYFECRI